MELYKLLPNSLPLPIDYYDKYNSIRRLKLLLFSDICNSYDEFKDVEDKNGFIKKIERGCYNAAITKATEQDIRNTWSNKQFVDLYTTICMKISTNLESSKKLFLKVLHKEINTNKLALMSSQELRPELHEKTLKKIADRANQIIQFKECRLYECSKCKSKKCKAEKLYNRSLDEGVNLEITCTECGHKWTS